MLRKEITLFSHPLSMVTVHAIAAPPTVAYLLSIVFARMPRAPVLRSPARGGTEGGGARGASLVWSPYLSPPSFLPHRMDSDCLRTCSKAMPDFSARPSPRNLQSMPGSGTERVDQSPRSLTRKATRHQQAKPLRGGNRMPVRPGTRQLLQYPPADRSGRPGLFLE